MVITRGSGVLIGAGELTFVAQYPYTLGDVLRIRPTDARRGVIVRADLAWFTRSPGPPGAELWRVEPAEQDLRGGKTEQHDCSIAEVMAAIASFMRGYRYIPAFAPRDDDCMRIEPTWFKCRYGPVTVRCDFGRRKPFNSSTVSNWGIPGRGTEFSERMRITTDVREPGRKGRPGIHGNITLISSVVRAAMFNPDAYRRLDREQVRQNILATFDSAELGEMALDVLSQRWTWEYLKPTDLLPLFRSPVDRIREYARTTMAEMAKAQTNPAMARTPGIR